MKTHTQNLLAIRPDLQLDSSQAGPEETFQNQTLRPILKMQHALLTTLFQAYIHKRKDSYFLLTKAGRLAWIDHSVRSDLRFRNLLVGTVIGHFAEAELAHYLASEAEYMRRIVSLLVQRLQSAAFVAPTSGGKQQPPD